MTFNRRPSACRQTAVALVWLLLGALAVSAREFSVQVLSDPKGNARYPAIGETGLVVWQGYTAYESTAPLHARPDALEAPRGTTRIDIYLWRGGEVQNITGTDSRITGRSERPIVSGDSVAFLAWFKNDAGGGFPFELSVPPKDESMERLEAEDFNLFDPPYLRSGTEVELSAGDTNAPAATADTNAPVENTQSQMWRASGKGADIAVYRAETGIQRLTPGTRHFCSPALSAAGAAFQCARGWPYGYEMVAWKAGATNLIQITTNYFYVLNPNIHGNELVFQAWDGNDYEIFRYRFDTDQMEQITDNQFDDVFPVVWNGEIAWVAHPTVTAEIFQMRDGVIRKISEGTEDNAAPSIWNGKIVWQGYDDTDLEIYYFNGRRTIKLTSNTWDDLSPQIRDGVIAWASYVDNWDAEIMAFDLGDNIAVQLTNNEFEDSFPQTAGEKIVWQSIGAEGTTVQMASPTGPRETSVE